MKRITTRILCLMLVGVFCITALIGCRKEEEGEVETTAEVTETESVSEVPTLNDHDTLGEYDFGGAEYKILSRKGTIYEFDHNNDKGLSTVNNAIYQRNEETATRFNVKLRIENVNGSWGSEEFVTKYQTVVQSGWSDYAMIAAHFAMVQMESVKGHCYDMTLLDTVDMKKEWWAEQFYENCNINGKFYVAVGDIAYSMYEYLQVVFFNETLAGSLLTDEVGEPVDLYQLVEDGEWTWAKLKEYTKKVNYDEINQQYGLLLNAHSIRSFATSFELNLLEKSGEGEDVRYSVLSSAEEKTSTAIDDIVSFVKLNVNNVQYGGGGGTSENEHNPMFSSGKGLFYTQMLGSVTTLAEQMASGQKYGVLPFPKYDEDQLEYRTAVRDALTAVSVPKNIKDPEMVGVVTEALCMYSYQNVRPAYLDTVVSGRYMTDDNMKAMLDIIRETFTVDFAMAYNPNMGSIFSTLSNLANSTTAQSYDTFYAGKVENYTKKLAEIYNAFGVS